MGLRGPARTPTALALMRGNPSHAHKANKREPKPSGALGRPPAHLGKIGKALWSQLVPQLRAMNIEGQCDRRALEAGCSAYEEWREARRLTVELGLTYTRHTAKHETVVVARPEVGIAADAQRRFVRFLQEFGLTPSARTRVHQDDAPAADPLETYLARPKQAARRG